jgi:hypothetical protein
MKIFQFYKTEYIALLILLSSPFPVLGDQFYNSLLDLKLKEPQIIDNHTVEIEIRPNNHSISCKTLEALQSVPYAGPGEEEGPETVFFNNEKVYKSTFYQNLSQSIKEEITIIDESMVEVAIGPDDRSVSATILHAVKSIPSVKEGVLPMSVCVNGKPIHHVENGVYTWDIEGRYLVRLRAKYIRKFGNIKVYVIGEKSSFVSKHDLGPLPYKDSTALVEPFPTANLPRKPASRLAVKEILIEKKNIVPEPIVTRPDKKEKPFSLEVPSTRLLPHKIMTGVVKGFRLAQFGMSEERVIKAIQADLSQSENNIEKRKDPETDQHILTISSPILNRQNGTALIHYYFSLEDKVLIRVDIIWGHPNYSKVDHAVLHESAEKFKNLFSQLVTESADLEEDKNPYIFYGEDILGNGVKLKWDTSYNKNSQTLSKPEPTLLLSYFQPSK